MAEGLNRVVLIGNLGEAPKLRHVNNDAVLQLRMATTESWYDQNSKSRKEDTQWHTVVIWGTKRAEALNNLLKTGSRLCVEGKLRTRMYEKDGQKHYPTEIVAQRVILLGDPQSKGKSQGEGNTSRGRSRNDAAGPDADDFGPSDYGPSDDDDIPF